MTENNAAQPGLTDDEILHRWDIYVSDPCAAYPLTDADKIDFARAIESALLSKLRAEGVQAGDEVEWAGYRPLLRDAIAAKNAMHEAGIRYATFGVMFPEMMRRYAAALASAPVAMIDTAKLAQLLDSVNGDCYLGKEKEEDLVQSLRSQLRARVAEPEWIDDPHDIEQGMMRNPKYVAPGHKPVDTSSGHSAPAAGEAQGVSVERLAKDPFLAAQLWRNPVDRAPVAGEAQSRGKFLPEHVTQQMIWNVQAVIEAECNGLALDTRQARNVMSFLMSEHGPDAAPQASEAVRSEHLERANKLPEVECPRCELKVISSCGSKGCPTNDGYADLCQPQADKDGGDCAEGAGDAEDAARYRLAASDCILILRGDAAFGRAEWDSKLDKLAKTKGAK